MTYCEIFQIVICFVVLANYYLYRGNISSKFFLVILKRMLQNYQKIMNISFLGTTCIMMFVVVLQSHSTVSLRKIKIMIFHSVWDKCHCANSVSHALLFFLYCINFVLKTIYLHFNVVTGYWQVDAVVRFIVCAEGVSLLPWCVLYWLGLRNLFG